MDTLEFYNYIIEHYNIAEKHHDLIKSYMTKHVEFEVDNQVCSNKFFTTLPYAMKVLSQLDLDRVKLVDSAKDYGYKVILNWDDLNYCADPEMHIMYAVCEDMVTYLNNLESIEINLLFKSINPIVESDVAPTMNTCRQVLILSQVNPN